MCCSLSGARGKTKLYIKGVGQGHGIGNISQREAAFPGSFFFPFCFLMQHKHPLVLVRFFISLFACSPLDVQLNYGESIGSLLIYFNFVVLFSFDLAVVV